MSKDIFVWNHPKKLYNKYFLKNKEYIPIDIRLIILKGIFILIFKLIFKNYDLYKFLRNLNKSLKPKNILTNFYALIFFSLNQNKSNKSINIIGDIYNPIYKGLLISSAYNNFEIWIIYQGTGMMQEKINFKYPKNVKRIFFPFSNEAKFEKDLLINANKKIRFIKFSNINSNLNIEISKKLNTIAIFQGYDKRKKLYPFYIFKILKNLIKIYFLESFEKFNQVTLFLHPRLGYLKILNLLKLKNNIKFNIYNHEKKYKFSYIISYSPTICSSMPIEIKNNVRFSCELGKNFKAFYINKKVNNLALVK